MLEELWPALTSAQHSEKPSIIKLFDWISEAVFRGLDTFALRIDIAEDVRKEKALALWEADSPIIPETAGKKGKERFPEEAEVAEGLKALQTENEANVKSYHGIIDKLCEQVEQTKS